jgi:hypothetical protein
MIIFGWGHQTTKNIGLTHEMPCGNCNNDTTFDLTRYRTWFTLFFIPVIPYENKYFLSCPICTRGVVLDNTQLETIQPMAELNKSLVDGHVTEV